MVAARSPPRDQHPHFVDMLGQVHRALTRGIAAADNDDLLLGAQPASIGDAQ